MNRFLILLLLLACGCTRTITRADLDTEATENAGNSFPDQTYYIGSKASYDYFAIESGLGGSAHRYRVVESEDAVTNRFDLTEDKAQWRGYGATGIVITNASQMAAPK